MKCYIQKNRHNRPILPAAIKGGGAIERSGDGERDRHHLVGFALMRQNVHPRKSSTRD